MKNPSTIEEQIQILKDKGFSISDEESAKKYLKHIWYYRLSHYFNYFLDNHNWEEHSFKNILNLYIFDRKLKLILSDMMERIEISLKTNLVNDLSLKYWDSCFFMNKDIYFDEKNYIKVIEWYEKEKVKNKSISKNGLNTIESWKLFDGLTFWSVVFSYWALSTWNKKLIAKNYNIYYDELYSWLLCLTDIRNICAHYDKLWWRKMTRNLLFKHPKLKWFNIDRNSIYAYVVIISIILKEIWTESHFLDKIEDLFQEEDYINIDKEKMWFSKNWKEDIEDLF